MKGQLPPEIATLLGLVIIVPILLIVVNSLFQNSQCYKDLESCQAKLSSSSQVIQQKDAEIQNLKQTISEKDNEIEQCKNDLSNCQKQLDNYSSQIKDLNFQLADCQKKLEEKNPIALLFAYLQQFFILIQNYYVTIYIISIGFTLYIGVKFSLEIKVKIKKIRIRIKIVKERIKRRKQSN